MGYEESTHNEIAQNRLAMVELHRMTHNLVVAQGQELSEIRALITRHVEEEPQQIIAAVKAAFAEAFVDGDAAKHRIHHEKDTVHREKVAENIRKMMFNIYTAAAICTLSWIAFSLWEAFLRGPIK